MPYVCAAHSCFITSVDYREVRLKPLGAGLDAGVEPDVFGAVELEGPRSYRAKVVCSQAEEDSRAAATGEVEIFFRRVTTSAGP